MWVSGKQKRGQLFTVIALAMALMTSPLKAGDEVKVSGRGEVPVAAVKAKEQGAANQRALAEAEAQAIRKAMKQAVFQIYGNEQALGPRAQEVLKGAADNSAAMVVDKQVTSAGVQGGMAVVEMVVRVDGKALREFLDSNYELSSTVQTEGKFKVYVLSYTVEGMDPNRENPQVLHEEVVEDQKAVQSSSHSSASVKANANSSAASYKGSYAASDKGDVKYSSEASLSAKGKTSESAGASSTGAGYIAGQGGSAGFYGNDSASYSSSASGSLNAKQSEKGSASWDSRESASVDARTSSSNASFASNAKAGSSYSDTSRYYRRVVDYKDDSKKEQGRSNEVRANLEGMMTSAGFDVATLDISLAGRQFASDDDLVVAILQGLRRDAGVNAGDYVAIALNSFTPLGGNTHRYTSKVTYRIVRVQDGMALLPAKDIVGDSGETQTDDVGKTYAVKSALYKVDEILPGEIKKAMAKMNRAEQRSAQQATLYFTIQITNAGASSSQAIRKAIADAGFGPPKRDYNGANRTDTITVMLNGRSGQDVSDAIGPIIDSGKFDVLALTDSLAQLGAK